MTPRIAVICAFFHGLALSFFVWLTVRFQEMNAGYLPVFCAIACCLCLFGLYQVLSDLAPDYDDDDDEVVDLHYAQID